MELQTVERESFSDFRDRWQTEHPEQVWAVAMSRCSLCNFMPQVKGGSREDAYAAMEKHRDSHADWTQWAAKQPPFDPGKFVDRLHKDCDHTPNGQCRCICGCTDALRIDCKPFPEGPLCSMCSWRHDVRDDEDHDDPERLKAVLAR